MEILGIRIDNLSKKEAFEKIEKFLVGKKTRQIVTVNPEFIVRAQNDDRFKKNVNDADLNLSDGIGIKLAFWRFGKNLKKRIAGADLMWYILDIADRRNLKVFLLANEEGLSSWQDTAECINKVYPNLSIYGENANISWSYFNSAHNKKMYDFKGSSILFCNFGAPYQEKFIASLKKADTGIKLAIGVGGGFDFVSGKIARAPRWLRAYGLEWLWRLTLQPNRLKRTIRAVIIFPIKVILNK